MSSTPYTGVQDMTVDIHRPDPLNTSSESSLLQSGVEYDSGAQDFCDESQSLHLLLRCQFPDLYHSVFPPPLSPLTTVPPQQKHNCLPNSSHATCKLIYPTSIGIGKPSTHYRSSDWVQQQNPPVQLTKMSPLASPMTDALDGGRLSVPTETVRHLFNCANHMYVQQASHLRVKVDDLTHRLQTTQTTQDMMHREVQRLQHERDRLHNELVNQKTYYEDHLSELHGVIGELRRSRSKLTSSGLEKLLAPDLTSYPNNKYSVCGPLSGSQNSGCASPSESVTDGNTSVGAVDGDQVESGVISMSGDQFERGYELPLPNVIRSTEFRSNPMQQFSFMKEPSSNAPCDLGPGSPTLNITALRTQLACRTEERDALAKQLNSLLLNAHPIRSATPASSSINCKQQSKPQSPNTNLMMTGHVEPNSTGNNNSCRRNHHLQEQHELQTNIGTLLSNTSDIDGCDRNIYDLSEPAWVNQCLEACENHNDVQTNSTEPSSASSHDLFEQLWVDRPTWSLSPRSFAKFLNELSKHMPYPRLADKLNCAHLTWSHLLANLGRLQADCVILHSNLSEVKAIADRMHCRLGQIEANSVASSNCLVLADACLEVGDCLNQLYATELAIVLHHHRLRKHQLNGHNFSTMSSSTSSSTSYPSGKPITRSNGHVIDPMVAQNDNSKLGPFSRPRSDSPTGQQHFYAIYDVPSFLSDNRAPNYNTPVQLDLPTLRFCRHQSEVLAQSVCDRYESADVSKLGLGLPHGPPIPFSTRLSTSHAPISPGLFSMHSAIGPTLPSTCSLTNTSLYANSMSAGVGQIVRTTLPKPHSNSQVENVTKNVAFDTQTDLTKFPSRTQPTSLSNPHRLGSELNPVSHHSATLPCSMGGGWQTPDSGAGSSSTNEVGLHQPLSFHPYLYLPTNGFGPVELSAHSNLLDSLPHYWSYARTNSMLCDLDSDSSDSSAAEQLERSKLGRCRSHPIYQSSWTRADERKLRALFNRLYQRQRAFRSTMMDLTNQISHTDGDTDSNRLFDSNKMYEVISQLCESPSVTSLSKLPLNALLENAVLLQELCSVKEERTDLKARTYLLENELQANRLTLNSRIAAERALRTQLDVIVMDRQHHQPHQKDEQVVVPVMNRNGQSEVTLLREQVRNLLCALEALRHSSELQQVQSDELMEELKQANTALIGAFEKAKRKYLTRIKKLEEQVDSTTKTPHTNSDSLLAKHDTSSSNGTSSNPNITPLPTKEMQRSGAEPNTPILHPQRVIHSTPFSPVCRPLPALPQTETPSPTPPISSQSSQPHSTPTHSNRKHTRTNINLPYRSP